MDLAIGVGNAHLLQCRKYFRAALKILTSVCFVGKHDNLLNAASHEERRQEKKGIKNGETLKGDANAASVHAPRFPPNFHPISAEATHNKLAPCCCREINLREEF